MQYDVFICHASEDKKEFVKPLADVLVAQNLKVWYDEFELTLGDSLREKIDYGLANSTYGVVVLSEAFFAKKWTKEELDGLVARQTSEGKKVILPVWHKVGYEDVKKFSPILAGKLAAKSEDGLEAVVAQVIAVVKAEPPKQSRSVFQTGDKESLRGTCLELIRNGDLIGWRDLVDKRTNEIIDKLLAWKQTGEKALSQLQHGLLPNWQPWKDSVLEAVKISIPGLIPVLTAIRAGKENYWRESTSFLLRLVLLYRDMGGGITHVLRIGDTILYIAGSIGMALAARTKQLNFVELWAGLTVPEIEGYGETIWCQTHEINYWQTGVTGHNDDPYGFVIGILELDDIEPFFNNGQIFKQFLFSGNLLHSMVEFKHKASQADYEEKLKHQFWSPNVMPIWCLMEPDDFRKETWRIFGSSTAVINFAYPGIISEDKFWPLWQAWKKRCVQFMSDGGRYHRHLHNIYSLNLPGEPPIQT